MFHHVIYKSMPAHTSHEGLRPAVGHLIHTNAKEGVVLVTFQQTSIVHGSAIYLHEMTSEYGLGGRPISTELTGMSNCPIVVPACDSGFKTCNKPRTKSTV